MLVQGRSGPGYRRESDDSRAVAWTDMPRAGIFEGPHAANPERRRQELKALLRDTSGHDATQAGAALQKIRDPYGTKFAVFSCTAALCRIPLRTRRIRPQPNQTAFASGIFLNSNLEIFRITLDRPPHRSPALMRVRARAEAVEHAEEIKTPICSNMVCRAAKQARCNRMNLPNLTTSQIRNLCTKSSFESGRRLYEQGNVASVKTVREILTAQVNEVREHHVSVSLRNGAECSCTCRHDGIGICMHAAAALLYAAENFKTLIARERKQRADINSILDRTTIGQLKSFLVPELERDDSLRGRLAACLEEAGTAPRNYRRGARQQYAHVFDNLFGFPTNFDELEKEAGAKEKKGNFAEAALIYREISEAISDGIGMNTDLEGDHCYFFGRALQKMTSCINRQKLEQVQKRQYISYMFEKFANDEPGCDKYGYDRALKSICTSKSDIAYWRSLLEDALQGKISPGRYPDIVDNTTRLVMMGTDLLERIGDGSAEGIYLAHYREDVQVCAKYIRYLSKADPGRARQVAAEGAGLFPKVTWLKDVLDGGE